MHLLLFVLFVAALVCFLLGAFNVAVRRINLIALGLTFWVLVYVLSTVNRV